MTAARWWSRFLVLWELVGVTELVRHNLLVAIHSDSHETRRSAAFEVAAAVTAIAASLRGVQP